MGAAPPGSLVKIYWDGWDKAEPGDYLRTTTGRTYHISEVRVQKRGRHQGRQHLTCVVMDPDYPVEPEATIHLLRWYPR